MAVFTPDEQMMMKKKKGSACLGITSGGGKSGESSKPTRVVKTPEQLRGLEAAYLVDPNPSRQAKVELGLKLGLDPRQVQLWFWARRKRDNNTPPPTNGGVPLPEKMNKKTTTVNNATPSSSSRSASSGSTASSQLVVKLRVPRAADPTHPILGGSLSPTTPHPMAAHWHKMPPLVQHSDNLSSALKRKFASSHPPPASATMLHNDSPPIQRQNPALKRPRLENADASGVGNKSGLTDEACRIFRELRKEAERCRDLEQCGGETNKKQAESTKPYPVGVPSASTAIHGKGHSGVAYAYCAETGQCFIITRRSPPLCPPRPVITHQQDIFCTTDRKPNPVPEQAAAAQESQIRRIQRREIQNAIKQGLKNFLKKRSR